MSNQCTAITREFHILWYLHHWSVSHIYTTVHWYCETVNIFTIHCYRKFGNSHRTAFPQSKNVSSQIDQHDLTYGNVFPFYLTSTTLSLNVLDNGFIINCQRMLEVKRLTGFASQKVYGVKHVDPAMRTLAVCTMLWGSCVHKVQQSMIKSPHAILTFFS